MIRSTAFVVPGGFVRSCSKRHGRLNVQLKRRFAITALMCLVPLSVRALDPAHHVTQYVHTAWRVQDGFAPVTRITQTADGYLWFAISTGLLRFDGVKFTPYDLPPLTPLIRGYNYILGARDGSLWIGTWDGMVRLKDGKVQWYSDPAQHSGVYAILEDPDGTIWFTRYRVPHGDGPLCRIEGRGVHCYGKADGIPVRYGLGLTRDSEGNLWLGSSALCRWRPGSGPAATYLTNINKHPDTVEGVVDVAAGANGTIWAATDDVEPGMGILSSTGGKWATFVVRGFDGTKANPSWLFMDRESALWIGTGNDGTYRVHNGIAEHFGTADGLSGRYVLSIYEDREGDIWILTDGGVDMFRNTAIVNYSQREGLSEAGIRSALALQDGSLWIGNANVIDIFDRDGRHSVLPAEGRFDKRVTSLFQDRKGTVWIARGTDLFAYDHGRFIPYKRPDGSGLGKRDISAITQDAIGNIWVLTLGHLLFQVEGSSAVQVLAVSDSNRISGSIAPDQQGGLWISSGNDVLTYYKDGNVRAVSMKIPDTSFSVSEVSVDSDDALLVATNQGLFRWDAKSWQKLDARNGLPGDVVLSVLRDNDNAVWVRCQKGLVRIPESEFDHWRRHDNYKPAMEVFDRMDGARPETALLPTQPSATKTSDGRLWFVADTVLQMIDPRQSYRNPIPPPVHIENLIADRKDYGSSERIRLPALSRDIEIDYTALSFVMPQRVGFRYKLEGRDQDWQETGTRRQAFYTSLSPGPYRFRVIASNNTGLWNEVGASLYFSVAPAYYQTTWFKAICLLGVAGFVYSAYRLRVRQVTSQLRGRMYERLAERERIARDLHDTFFQGIQGLLLRFHTVTSQLARDEPARRMLEETLKQSDQVMLEGRELVLDLRETVSQYNDLPTALADFGEGMQEGVSCDFKVAVTGTIRPLHPVVFEELFKIGKEALGNAFWHSEAHSIEAELNYERSELRIRIRDDGKGIDSTILRQGHRDGHFGLPGMRERAKKVGAHLDVWSRPGAGTEIELRIAGSIAYVSDATRSLLWRLRCLWPTTKSRGWA